MSFKPCLRFAVMSDIHYNDEDCPQKHRFRKAMKDIYDYCGRENYDKLDALYIVGDFTNNGCMKQMTDFKSDLDECVLPGTKAILTVASHEFFFDGEKNALERFDAVYGQPLDTHEVINGFHFVGLTTTNGCRFNDEKKAFLREKLELSAKEDRRRPIFVFQHPHITDTVFGSIDWGDDALYPILADYPQVIDFSGHSHAPLRDPRSVHQRHFTSLGTGTLYYFELDEFDKYYGTVPPDKEAAECLIVEVDEEYRVKVRSYDILSGNFYDNDRMIERPWDPSSFKYTDQRYKTAVEPYFPDDSFISADKKSEDTVTVTFTQAVYPGDRINAYTVLIKSDDYIIRSRSLWSGYYHYQMPDRLSLDIEGLEKGVRYTVEVTAESFWLTSSKTPLTTQFVL